MSLRSIGVCKLERDYAHNIHILHSLYEEVDIRWSKVNKRNYKTFEIFVSVNMSWVKGFRFG